MPLNKDDTQRGNLNRKYLKATIVLNEYTNFCFCFCFYCVHSKLRFDIAVRSTSKRYNALELLQA